MASRERSGGIAAWSIRRPVAVVMLALTVVVLGLFSLDRLAVDLLPHIIYPEVRVRVLNPGVPARIMEDEITRQLEEQLAITEGAIAVQSTTTEGRSSVDLSFPYGTDIDRALRDASTRLDRARRFLPTTIEPPIIYKRDPAQIPVLELAVSSRGRDSVQLRDWVDYAFRNWFLNLPGVAAAEVGGGQRREIRIQVDQERLAALGRDFADIESALAAENREYPGGRILVAGRELASRADGRAVTPARLGELPIGEPDSEGRVPRLRDVAQIFDTHEDERLRVRLNGQPAIKLSIQKQPDANTVAVVDAVRERLAWLRQQRVIPDDIDVAVIADQSVFIRHSLRNASLAVLGGALLAMLVVWLFLGDLTRTLIIGLAIPLAILVTFIIMAVSGLTLNIMTLGGLAVGVGMLVDNTIVMLENMTRHQQAGEHGKTAARNAAAEVTGAITASTSTNLAAILPFLFISGLIGLLFRELIVTISAAILASLVVAITLVPALGARSRLAGRPPRPVSRALDALRARYVALATRLLPHSRWLLIGLLPPLALSAWFLLERTPIFLPQVDEGRVVISVSSDPGTELDAMDGAVQRIEEVILARPEVESLFVTVGGFIFGRSEFQSSHFSGLYVQLVPRSQRDRSSQQWVREMQQAIDKLDLVGFRVRMRVRGVRGVHLGRGDDDISVRIQGDDLDTLRRLGDAAVERLQRIPGLRNLQHNYEDLREELVVQVDRERAALLGIDTEAIGRALQVALEGRPVSDYREGDRRYPVRLRLPHHAIDSLEKAENLLVGFRDGRPIRLGDVATLRIEASPDRIKRDNQRRIVEISASLGPDLPLGKALDAVDAALADFPLPDGYSLYDGGVRQQLQESEGLGEVLLGLALFLVFVVMAVQYESLRNPLIILLGIPFSLLGVATGIAVTGMPVSVPVWLGLIMLAGIVVNNAIVLVEQIEIEREAGRDLDAAILDACRVRLRPILMTTLTTALGMLPLALGLGEGAEMLQPLAIVIVWGLLFSLLVSLLVVPGIYRMVHGAGRGAAPCRAEGRGPSGEG